VGTSADGGLIKAAAPVESIPFKASLRVKGLSIGFYPPQHVAFNDALANWCGTSPRKQLNAERGKQEN
jgi:hypothetical protein